MAFKKKAWVDRVAEFINRRTLTKEDGSTELVTVARSEGTISKEGDAFNAETMNDLEERILTGFSDVDTELKKRPVSHASTGTGYGVGSTTKYGHVKTINVLTKSAYADGEALSAYQGYLLEKSIEVMKARPAWIELATGIVKMSISKKPTGDVTIVCSSAPGVVINANTWTIIDNLVAEYRPAINIPFIGSYGTATFIGYVYTNGNIVVYTPTAITVSGSAMCFNIKYPV